MDPRPQGLRRRLVVKFGGSSTVANDSVSPLGARHLYALEQQNLGREPEAPRLLQFIVRVPSFAVFGHRYFDVYFVPGERYNGCARRDMTLPVMEGCFGEYVVVELRPGGITQVMTRANKEYYVSTTSDAWQIAEQFRVLLLDV
ncbi:hypothetical protein EDB86DRAFT_3072912 [Lactarius hatsudake]|nr:hypothetical protein EDB86DRAFT_3072912 [Lactarius hatsudake]